MTTVAHGHVGAETDHSDRHGADGMDCPECAALVQVYRLRISAALARDLIFCHQRYGTAPFLIPEVAPHLSDDFLRLKHWGLITNSDDAANLWHITPEGEQWLRGETSIPKYAMFYNGCLVKMTEGNRINIPDLLGTDFAHSAA